MKNRPLIWWLTAAIVLSACSAANPEPTAAPTRTLKPTPETYTLKMMVNPVEGGQVLPGDGEYAVNTMVILNAIPSKGFVFDSWSGDVSGKTNTLSINFTGDTIAVANFSQLPTPTPKPPPTATPEPCRKPAAVSPDDAGQLIEVCGEVTNWGNVPCPNCALGGYSFLKLDGEFLIISYDWVFNNNWIGYCIIVADTVEMLGAAPVFIFGSGEGYAGSECYTKEDGTRSCSSGEYFLEWYGCEAEE